MSLSGRTIAITGSRRASELAHLITVFGGKPYLAPTVGIETRHDIAKIAQEFTIKLLKINIRYVVFMTGPGVYSLMSGAAEAGVEKKLIEALQHVKIVARSVKPRQALANYGIMTDLIPRNNTAEGIVKMLKDTDIVGEKIMVLWHGSYSTFLKNELNAGGTEVFEFSTYTYSHKLTNGGAKIFERMGFNYMSPDESKVVKLIQDIKEGNIHAITFTSPPAVRDFFQIAEHYSETLSLQLYLNTRVIVAAIGPSTKKAIEGNMVLVDVMPTVYKMGSMVKSLSDYMSKSNKSKIKTRSTLEEKE